MVFTADMALSTDELGITFRNAMCRNADGKNIAIIEKSTSPHTLFETSNVFTHEVGHMIGEINNFILSHYLTLIKGMRHDYEQTGTEFCEGIMNWANQKSVVSIPNLKVHNNLSLPLGVFQHL